jgi:hypothetical protein
MMMFGFFGSLFFFGPLVIIGLSARGNGRLWCLAAVLFFLAPFFGEFTFCLLVRNSLIVFPGLFWFSILIYYPMALFIGGSWAALFGVIGWQLVDRTLSSRPIGNLWLRFGGFLVGATIGIVYFLVLSELSKLGGENVKNPMIAQPAIAVSLAGAVSGLIVAFFSDTSRAAR